MTVLRRIACNVCRQANLQGDNAHLLDLGTARHILVSKVAGSRWSPVIAGVSESAFIQPKITQPKGCQALTAPGLIIRVHPWPFSFPGMAARQQPRLSFRKNDGRSTEVCDHEKRWSAPRRRRLICRSHTGYVMSIPATFANGVSECGWVLSRLMMCSTG
jgi:hypothetical protein